MTDREAEAPRVLGVEMTRVPGDYLKREGYQVSFGPIKYELRIETEGTGYVNGPRGMWASLNAPIPDCIAAIELELLAIRDAIPARAQQVEPGQVRDKLRDLAECARNCTPGSEHYRDALSGLHSACTGRSISALLDDRDDLRASLAARETRVAELEHLSEAVEYELSLALGMTKFNADGSVDDTGDWRDMLIAVGSLRSENARLAKEQNDLASGVRTAVRRAIANYEGKENDGLELCILSRNTLIDDLRRALSPAKSPAPQAEREIKVGSRWRNGASDIIHKVYELPDDHDSWRRRYTWVSDPEPQPVAEREES